MKVLLTIPHIFAPKEGSMYSSQTWSKRDLKTKALYEATIGNLNRHRKQHWIHASLGKGQRVVNREIKTELGMDIKIKVFTNNNFSLADSLPEDRDLEIIITEIEDLSQIPLVASRYLLERASEYDILGYMEDDLILCDTEFFLKIKYLESSTKEEYAFLPHRCEHIPGKGDVILSGDPDGGRADLFWATGEKIAIDWQLSECQFYRATNPHSGCYFLGQKKAMMVRDYWIDQDWRSKWSLSGPLEQAGSGMLLPKLKLMKPIPSHYRFLMVMHQDSLWKRHDFEN